MATLAPSASNAPAMANPIPFDAPVTSAFLPRKNSLMKFSLMSFHRSRGCWSFAATAFFYDDPMHAERVSRGFYT
jgi:hypothetical protein